LWNILKGDENVMNPGRIRGKMAELGITIGQLAAELGLSHNALTGKLNGKREFRMGEMIRVAQILGLSNEDMRTIYPGWP